MNNIPPPTPPTHSDNSFPGRARLSFIGKGLGVGLHRHTPEPAAASRVLRVVPVRHVVLLGHGPATRTPITAKFTKKGRHWQGWNEVPMDTRGLALAMQPTRGEGNGLPGGRGGGSPRAGHHAARGGRVRSFGEGRKWRGPVKTRSFHTPKKLHPTLSPVNRGYGKIQGIYIRGRRR